MIEKKFIPLSQSYEVHEENLNKPLLVFHQRAYG